MGQLYIKQQYEVVHLTDWNLCSPEIEYQWLNLKLRNTRDTLICNVYRPPDGNTTNAIELLENKILDIYAEGLPDVNIARDMNINLLNITDPKTIQEQRFIKCLKFTQLLDTLTRVTDRSQTLIDHFMTNRQELYNTSGVVVLGISDHDLTFSVRKK